MKTFIKLFLLIIFLINVANCKAQQDSLNYKVIDYLIKKGELDKTNNNKDYFNNIFIVNLIKKKNEPNFKCYLYKIGLYSSHSSSYLLLTNKNKYEFIDVRNLDEVLMHIIKVSREKKRPSEEILKNVEAIIVMYQMNLKAIPWKNK